MRNGQIEVLAIGDRFSAAYTSIDDVIKALGDVTYRTESSFSKAEDAVDFVRNSSIDLVVMPNPYGNERRKWIYFNLKKYGFPVLVFDRGALPRSWFFDVGFNADSETYHPLNWDVELTDDETARVNAFIESAKEEKELEAQSPRIGASELKKKLQLEGKKILFVPFQRPSDTTIKFFADPIGTYDNFARLVNETSTLLNKQLPEWVVIAKKHPLESTRPSVNVRFVDDGTNVNDLLAMCDAVLLVNSGVGVLSSLYEKPVFHAGTAFYSHPDINKQVSKPEDIVYWIKKNFRVDVNVRNKFVSHLINKVYSFGDAETELVAQKDGSFRNITRKIAFDQFRLPSSIQEIKKKRELLFVTPVIPVPINRGSAHRTDQMIQGILSNGFRVRMIILNQSESGTKSLDIKRRVEQYYGCLNVSVEVRKHPKIVKISGKPKRYIEQTKNLVRKMLFLDADINSREHLPPNFSKLVLKELSTGRYDYVWFNYLKVKPSGLLSPNLATKVVVDLHDLQVNRVEVDVLPTLSKLRRAKYLARFQRSERAQIKDCDIAISISPAETEQIRNKYQAPKQLHTVKATDFHRTLNRAAPDNTVVFVGSNSSPNVDGLCWFIEEILPIVTKNSAKAKLQIYGPVCRNSNVSRAVNSSPYRSAIELKGFVANLDDAYSNATVIVCPIRYGTGMKIKVVEAMAYGKAIVGTSVAFEGISTSPELIFDTPEAFASQLQKLLSSEFERRRIENVTEELFDEHHSFGSLVKNIGSILS